MCIRKYFTTCNFCCLATKKKIDEDDIFDIYRQILLLWQQFIPEIIQNMHLTIKSNHLAQWYDTYGMILFWNEPLSVCELYFEAKLKNDLSSLLFVE